MTTRFWGLLLPAALLFLTAGPASGPPPAASGRAPPSRSLAAEPIWGQKPVLGFLLSPAGAWEDLAQSLALDESQVAAIRWVVLVEELRLRQLYGESQEIVREPTLSLEEKREQIRAMNYNGRLAEILRFTEERLAGVLGEAGLSSLRWWVEARWAQARSKYGIPEVRAVLGPSGGVQSLTYRVYATQYAAHTEWEVALPDKCIKFANRGWPPCSQPGYDRNDYKVDLRRGQTTVSGVIIWDVGPWNIDDNYWSTGSAPSQPRRLFTDLPQGMPEAQAAYYDNYNGGLDQFGRRVTVPTAIDLSFAVAQALGLGYLQNDWIEVTYTWMGPTPTATPTPTPTPTRTATPTPTATATPTATPLWRYASGTLMAAQANIYMEGSYYLDEGGRAVALLRAGASDLKLSAYLGRRVSVMGPARPSIIDPQLPVIEVRYLSVLAASAPAKAPRGATLVW